MIDFKELVKVGLHFGHQVSRWSPKMKPYIWGHRNGIHLIDVSKIAYNLEKSANFLKNVASRGETILWVGTKKQAKDSVEKIATMLDMPYVINRWIGGTITNLTEVKKAVTKFLNFEEIVDKSKKDETIYTKKEIALFEKNANRLKKLVNGLKNFKMPIGAIVIIDVKKEHTAIIEAQSVNVPIVALADTNVDPSGIEYIIPGNDDSVESIKYVLDFLYKNVQDGLEIYDTIQAEKILEEEKIKKEKINLRNKERDDLKREKEDLKIKEANNKKEIVGESSSRLVVAGESINDESAEEDVADEIKIRNLTKEPKNKIFGIKKSELKPDFDSKKSFVKKPFFKKKLNTSDFKNKKEEKGE